MKKLWAIRNVDVTTIEQIKHYAWYHRITIPEALDRLIKAANDV